MPSKEERCISSQASAPVAHQTAYGLVTSQTAYGLVASQAASSIACEETNGFSDHATAFVTCETTDYIAFEVKDTTGGL